MGSSAESNTESNDVTTAIRLAIRQIAQQFADIDAEGTVRPLGQGNINDTYLVSGIPQPFVLQRLNHQVFPEPHRLMDNLHQLIHHARQRLSERPGERPWQVPAIVPTRGGQPYWTDPQGHLWRALEFIDGATTLNTVQTATQAQEVGYGLGYFHLLLSDLSPASLTDTLPGFHITPGYLETYGTVAATASCPSPEAAYCYGQIAAHGHRLDLLETLKQRGQLPLRPIHGDPKVNNILFDRASGQAISLIDLDTVKPGLVHYDIGDCLRSSCNRLGEETEQWQQVYFDLDICSAVLQGYLASAQNFLEPVEYDYLGDAAWLIAFELGLRFFTDYLAGNQYFKVRHPTHNLRRALVQFKLAESIDRQAEDIQALVSRLKQAHVSPSGV